MSFSYNDSETEDKDKVRGAIGDTVQRDGPRPTTNTGEGSNFSDEVITARIAREKVWQRAVANLFETLAAEWSKKASMNASGGGQSTGIQYNNVAEQYRKEAALWRKRYGYIEDDNSTTEGVSLGIINLGFQSRNV
jgi:hypothetical protein